MKRRFAIVHCRNDDDEGYTILAPSLPGYIGFAESRADVERVAAEGLAFHLRGLAADGDRDLLEDEDDDPAAMEFAFVHFDVDVSDAALAPLRRRAD